MKHPLLKYFGAYALILCLPVGTLPAQTAAAADSRLAKTFMPEMYGARPVYAATVDDTTFVEKAIAAAGASIPHGLVLLNRQYRILTANGMTVATSGLLLKGASRACGFTAHIASGNILAIVPPVTPNAGANTGLANVVLEDLTITNDVPMTGGWSVFSNWTNNLTCSRLQIGTANPALSTRNNIYGGIALLNSGAAHITGCNIYAHMLGVQVTGSADLGFGFAGYTYDGLIDGETHLTGDTTAGSIGLELAGGCGGFKAKDGNITGFAAGGQTDNSVAGVTNREFYTSDFFFDGNVSVGFAIQGQSLNVFKGVNAWFCGNGRSSQYPGLVPPGTGYGFYASSPYCHLNLTGSHIYLNGSDGICASAGIFTLSGANVYQNGQNGSAGGTGNGVRFISTDLACATITGGHLIGNAGFGVVGPSSKPILVVGVDLSGNTAGAYDLDTTVGTVLGCNGAANTPLTPYVKTYTVPAGGQSNIAIAIPAGYHTIRLEGSAVGSASTTTDLYFQFNSDSAAHYQYERMYAVATIATTPSSSTEQVSGDLAGCLAGSGYTATPGTFSMIIPGYASTALGKSWSATSGGPSANGMYVFSSTGSWNQSAAISSVSFLGSFAAGTVITVHCE